MAPPCPVPISPLVAPPLRPSATSLELRTARRVWLAAVAYTAALTSSWLVLLATGIDGGSLFAGYQPNARLLARIVAFNAIFMLLYGWVWYRARRALLCRVAGLSELQLAQVFASRMSSPFHLPSILSGHAERTIRIIDMIGRRGRSLTLAWVYMAYVYARIASGTEPRFLTAALADGLLDAIVMSWIYVAAYYSNGLAGRIVYGAPARIMDGRLGRANLLTIVTLWSAFKFVMVPIGAKMAPLFPHRHYAAIFGFVWLSYQAADTLAEVVGCTIGRQKLRVWGLGEVNRKSAEGTVACFLGSLSTCLVIVWANGLPAPWVALALAVSVSNTLLELFSPRGTDDFTMATANALLCWAFGAIAA